MRPLVVFVLAFLCFGHALALAPGNISYPGGNRGVVSPPAPTAQSVIAAASNGSAKVSDQIRAIIGARDVTVTTGRVVTPAAVAKVIGRGLAPVLAVGVVADLAANMRCRYSHAPGGGWKCDYGQPSAPEGSYRVNHHVAASPQDAYVAAFADFLETTRAAWQGPGLSVTAAGNPLCNPVPGGNDYGCSGLIAERRSGGVVVSVAQFDASAFATTRRVCPAGQTLRSDGLTCTTPETDWGVATATEVETRAEPLVAANPVAVVRDVLQPGVLPLRPNGQPDIEFGPQELTGPATVQQPTKSTTVTDAQGNPRTTTETTTNHITYQGDSFTWHNTTVINYPDGGTEVKEDPPPDDKSECEKNPEAVGCQRTDVPDGPDLGEREVPVSFSPDAGWGADGGACPAPRIVMVLGHAVPIDNSLVCGFLSGIRPAVIGLFGLAAAMIFVGGIRS